MTPQEYARHDALALAALVRAGGVTPLELLQAAVARVESRDGAINAVPIRFVELAEARARGPLSGPFAGVPFLLKNLLGAKQGTPLTAGARALAGNVCRHDAELVRRLEGAGLVAFGRTNCPEFGLAPTTEPSFHGATRNPWDPAHTAGGSSGGAAASVAAGYVPMAHGNDGGGSIRIPASCCGVFGLKPTRGRVPLGPDYGDLIGGLVVEHALTRSVRDSAALLDVTAGPMLGDPYAAPPLARPLLEECGAPIDGLRVAFSVESPLGGAVDAECQQAARDAARLLEARGCHVEEAAPAFDGEAFVRHFTTLWAASVAKSVESIARVAGIAPSAAMFEVLTWALHERGKLISAAEYMIALEELQRLSRRVAVFFASHDLWVTPTLAMLPPKLGWFAPDPADPFAAAQRGFDFNPFCLLANATGQPAMSMPLGLSRSGLPIGVHAKAGFGREDVLFRVAAACEGEFVSSPPE